MIAPMLSTRNTNTNDAGLTSVQQNKGCYAAIEHVTLSTSHVLAKHNLQAGS
jgi:hypothetical protein